MQEYDRWRHGERKYLYTRSKAEFKERFGEWIASVIQDNPAGYVEKLLHGAVAQRRQMPCVVFDNADHFPLPFQEAVFQYAQGVFRNAFTFVICPITDKTIWQLSKAGPFQSYDTTAFYLPVPSTKDVLGKRVAYLKKKVRAEKSGESGHYALARGQRLTIQNVEGFAAAVEDIFIDEEYVGRIIGWLANHDIRRSLKIAHRVISSPMMGVESLVRAYVVGHGARPQRRDIKKALLVGDYTHFKASQSEYILNVFEVAPMAMTSPLLRLSVLRLLMDRKQEARNPETPYVMVDDIENYFEPMRLPRRVVDRHLRALLEHRLIEPYDPTDTEVYGRLRIRVTHAGRIHSEFAFATREANYLQQMAMTTPMRSCEALEEIKRLLRGQLDWPGWQQLVSVFAQYCIDEDDQFVSIPSAQAYDGQRDLRARFKNSWIAEDRDV
jgi:DNA-binding transcriptional ArsR family regulator